VPGEEFVLPHRNLRIAVFCLAYAVMFAIGFDFFALQYWVKLGIDCCCVITAGLIIGCTPGSQQRGIWQFNCALIMPGPFLIIASANLAGLYDLPLERRDAAMLSPTFLLPLALLLGLHAISFFIGKVAFGRLYPDQVSAIAVSPVEQEEIPPETKRFLRRGMLAVALCFLPSIIALIWFPHLHIRLMLISVAMMMCVLSFLTGRRWSRSDRSAQILALSLVVIGPVAMFVGLYFGAVDHHKVFHLAKALRYVAILLAVMLVPGLVGCALLKESQEADD